MMAGMAFWHQRVDVLEITILKTDSQGYNLIIITVDVEVDKMDIQPSIFSLKF